ncbi:MAG: right-handed parallel beta-helix repeat-containing protein [Candidatus Kapabacteria bacterium]|nr:right-handed parallel beta-helix repeat-containing protein [Candidatus Kapabacteria bacterium]
MVTRQNAASRMETVIFISDRVDGKCTLFRVRSHFICVKCHVMKCLFSLLLLTASVLAVNAQPSGDVPMPKLYGDSVSRVTVYLSPVGRQGAVGTREDPVSSFTPAIARMKELTSAISGRIACAFVFLPGRYRVMEPFIQFGNNYKASDPFGVRTLELSFIGEGDVVLDASGIQVPNGQGVISTSGSGIEIRNLRVVNSSQFGLRLGSAQNRSTNVRIENVTIDSTFSHGILIGDASSPLADTVALIDCRITNTNQMNVRGSTGQFGSALKLFGARDVNVIDCQIGRNWGEAVCINNSSRVRVRECTIYDNWAPGVYCDAGSDVIVSGCTFRSEKDTTVFPAGKRGMVGVLISTEAWSGSPTELRSGDIDIANNVFINMAGCLDVWEGTMSFLQRQIIENVRFVHNTCIGMWTTKGNTSTAFVNLVYSAPFPTNRLIRSIFVGNNIFSVDPAQVAPNRWVRMPAEAVPAFTYPSNYWSASVPGIASTFGNVIAPSLPLTEPASLLPESTPSIRGRVPRLPWLATDAAGRSRYADSTNAGAYEFVSPSSIAGQGDHCGQIIQTVYGTSARVCAHHERILVQVFALNGSVLTSEMLDAGECRIVTWPVMQPVLLHVTSASDQVH